MVLTGSERLRTWSSTTTWGSARWQRALAALVTAVIVQPQWSVDAGVGVDPSWEAVLALAPLHHLAWGRDVVFTYGPLGFLQTVSYYSYGQSVLASLYQMAVVAALFLGVCAVLRLRCAPMTSLLIAFATTAGIATLQVTHGNSLGLMYPELAILASLAWAAVPMLQQNASQSTMFITCVAIGLVGGLQLLVKFNTGFTTLAIGLAASVLLGWKAVGRHCATVVAFGVSVVICWLLAGQQLENLFAWLKYSAAIVAGYNEAQAVPLPLYAIPALLMALLWVGALCWAFARGGTDIPRSFIGLVGVATLITAKSAFGRYDLWHISMLVGLIVVSVVLAPFPRVRLRAIALAAVVLAFLVAGGPPALRDRSIAALQAPAQSVGRLTTLALPGRFDHRIQQAKARQREFYAVPDRFLTTMGSGTVHVDPVDTTVVWAYNLAWQPAPVFATYSTYLPALDQLNSDSLSGRTDFVLSRVSTASPAAGINGRLAAQESPLYSRALLCNFAVAGVENKWALFTRSAQHCGPLTKISEVEVSGNGSVKVPAPSAPDMAVLVGIDLNPTIIDRLFQGTILPLTTPTVTLDGTSYRLVTGNAAEPFLVNTPGSVRGTNLEIHSHAIGVGRSRALGQGPANARLRFYEMRVTP
ncbi:hypothetical protein [Mycobacterium asiaticum]|uniref:Transmembrane protein n=1 Tax=Mycobacterium asiaticum TaxID=1790 RepID=A0A1A3CSP9_MYCAS|nr:hypothetical protein [Mycobacterium asiaticum]OBI89838.1 hypothetical protein A9X01_13450 [Mycobacterium asiaticum]